MNPSSKADASFPSGHGIRELKLDVCVFSHNPRPHILQIVFGALTRQSLSKEKFHVWIVDNASAPPLGEADVKVLREAGVHFTLMREERLGVIFARQKASQHTTSDWVVFVDDDNELADDYLSTVIEIISGNPCLGCFGGKLLLPESLAGSVPQWMEPMLKFLAIKDVGDEPISKSVSHWGEWEPPGAGAVVKRPVLQWYLNRMQSIADCGKLDRKGRNGIFSAGDSLIMRGAYHCQLDCSYQPRLRLKHHINPRRFNFKYMLRLCYGYGRSNVILERILGNEIPPAAGKYIFHLLTRIPRSREKACDLAWKWGHYFESRSPLSQPAKDQ